MRRTFKRSIVAAAIIALLGNTLPLTLARPSRLPFEYQFSGPTPSPQSKTIEPQSAEANPDVQPGLEYAPNKSVAKGSSLQGSGAEDEQESEASGVSSQSLTGPFNSITLTNGSLRFKRPKSAGSFTAPVSAAINGIAFPEVQLKKKGRQLFLKGAPSGKSLDSLFPDGASVGLTIMNGDGTKMFLVLRRQGVNISVLPPSINGAGPSLIAPLSIMPLEASNSSPAPEDNILVFATRDNREFRAQAITVDEGMLTFRVPLIPTATPNTFYTGPVGLRLETAPGYASNEAQFSISPLPDNGSPVGTATQDYIRQLEALVSEVESNISQEFSEQDLDPDLIKAIRDLPYAAIDRFKSLVDNALAGRPQTILLDSDNDGVKESVSITRETVSMLDRLIISSGIGAQVASTASEIEALNSAPSGLCPKSEKEERIIADAKAYKKMQALGYVSKIISLLSSPDPATQFALLVADLTIAIQQAVLGLKRIKIVDIEVSPSPAIIEVNERVPVSVKGVFDRAESVGNTIRDIILTSVSSRLKLVPKIEQSKLLQVLVDALEEAAKRADINLDHIYPTSLEYVPLSSHTTEIIFPDGPLPVALGELCNGFITMRGLSETSPGGVTYEIRSHFPLSDTGNRLFGIEDIIQNQRRVVRVNPASVAPLTAAFQMNASQQSSPATASDGQTMRLSVPSGGRINVRFDASRTQQLNPTSGPFHYLWQIRTLSGEVAKSEAEAFDHSLPLGNYTALLTVTDRNRRRATSTANIIVSPIKAPPVAGFTMAADDKTAKEGETLPLIVAAGGVVIVNFSAKSRSFDGDGGPLKYDWRISGTPKSSLRDFHFGLGKGSHRISLTVTDDEGHSTSTSATVDVEEQDPSQPIISDISPLQSTTGTFPITIRGSNFDPSSVEVVLLGPDCAADKCVVPNIDLATKTASLIEARLQINNPGDFSLRVRNGTAGLLSNAKPLKITGASIQPAIKADPATLNFNVQQGASEDAQILNINSAGSERMNWAASAITNGGGQWLSLSFSTGATPSTTTVRVSPAGLAPGDYTGRITISADGAANGPLIIPVALRVNASPAADFSVQASPQTRTVTQGGSAVFTVTIQSGNGFNSPVDLFAINLPGDQVLPGTGFNPQRVTPAPNGSVTSVLTLATNSQTPSGTFSVIVRGVSGSLIRETTINLTVNSGPSPDLSISVSPATQSVTQGGTVTYTVTLQSINGFSSAVSLSALNLPGNLVLPGTGFNPQTITPSPNGAAISTFTLVTNNQTPTGAFPITFRAISGTLSRETTASVNVSQAANPDFSLSVAPSGQTLTQGGAATYTVSVQSINGFNSPVSLAALNLPGNLVLPGTAFSPQSITPSANGSANSTFTLVTNSQTPVGTFRVTFRGVSGNLIREMTASITVNQAPNSDFSISVSPASRAVTQGGTIAYTVTVHSLNGFNGSVVLSALNLPGNLVLPGTGFNPNSITPPANATASSTFTLVTNGGTPTGTFTITMRGVNGSLVREAAANVTVNPAPSPSFSISVSPASQSVTQGGSAAFTVTIQSVNGFNQAVSLFALNLPGNLVLPGTGFDPQPITPAANGAANSTFRLVTNGSTPTGTFTVTFRGVSGSLTSETTANVTVNQAPNPSFSISVSPGSHTVTQGGTAIYTVTIQSSNGFSAPVSLSALNLPGNLVLPGTGFSPQSITPPANGAASSTFSLVTNGSTPTGTFTVTFRGVNGSLTREAAANVSVNPAANPDFSLSISPGSRTLTQGNSATYTVTVQSINGFNSAVNLSALNLPGNIVLPGTGFNPPSITPPANGSASSTFTLMTNNSTPVGTFTITFRGAGGSLTREITANVIVNQAPNPDYIISVSPSGQTLTQGGAATYTVSVQSINGFNSPVSLFALNLPGNLVLPGTGFNPQSITPPSNGIASSIFTLVTNGSTPTGGFTITFRGVSGNLTKQTTANITVNQAPNPNFSISVSPSSRTISRGATATYTVTIQSLNGFSNSVSLFAINLPGNQVLQGTGFNPSQMTPPTNGVASSTFTFVSNGQTPTGSFTITIRGVSGSLTRERTINLTINP